MKRLVSAFLFGWLLCAGSNRAIAGEVKVLENLSRLEEVLQARKLRVVAEVGTLEDNVPEEDQKQLKDQQEKRVPAPQGVSLSSFDLRLAHIIWLNEGSSGDTLRKREAYIQFEVLLPPTAPGSPYLGFRRVSPEGKEYIDRTGLHDHGERSYQVAFNLYVKTPVGVSELVSILKLGDEEIQTLLTPKIEPLITDFPFVIASMTGGLSALTVLGFIMVRRRKQRRIVKPARQVYRPPSPSLPRPKRQRIPFAGPPCPHPEPTPEITPEEIHSECEGIIEELRRLLFLAPSEESEEQIRGYIAELDLPDTMRRLRKARHRILDARSLVWPDEMPEELPHSDAVEEIIHSSEERVRIFDLFDVAGLLPEDVDEGLAKEIILILLRPGRHEPYVGMRRIGERDLLKAASAHGLEREPTRKTILRLVQLGVVLKNDNAGTEGGRYSLQPHARDASESGAEIVHRAFALRRTIITKRLSI